MRNQDSRMSKNFRSTLLSCEKDMQTIWERLFIESRPYSDKLIRLLVLQTPNCLDKTQVQYKEVLKKYDLATLKKEGYIKVVPKLPLGEHEEMKSYILLDFDDFTPTSNPEFRDCTISFIIMCPLDQWELEDYKLRPHQILGYIDGILNESRLSGIGKLEFMGASELNLDEDYAGFIARYRATHGREDDERRNPEWPAPQNHDGFNPPSHY